MTLWRELMERWLAWMQRLKKTLGIDPDADKK